MKKLAWLFLLLPLLVSGCHHRMREPDIKGSGKRAVVKREITAFTGIVTEGAFAIEVTCQKDVSLEIEGDENILSLVKAEVGNNVLHLTNSENYSVSEPVRIRITVPNLESLSVSGAGDIDIKGMNNEKFEIDADGAPKIRVAGATKVVDIKSNGAGQSGGSVRRDGFRSIVCYLSRRSKGEQDDQRPRLRRTPRRRRRLI
jgi:hypothetical protein